MFVHIPYMVYIVYHIWYVHIMYVDMQKCMYHTKYQKLEVPKKVHSLHIQSYRAMFIVIHPMFPMIPYPVSYCTVYSILAPTIGMQQLYMHVYMQYAATYTSHRIVASHRSSLARIAALGTVQMPASGPVVYVRAGVMVRHA